MTRPRTDELRATAARVLEAVLHRGRSLSEALPATGTDQARLRALCYGVLRHKPLLRRLLGMHLVRPLKRRDAVLEALLLAAIYELGFMRTAPHAAIDRAVAATRALDRPWAAGLVNAILRAYQRAGKPRAVPDPTPEERTLHPSWLIDALHAAWPQDFDRVIDANNRQGPLWLRTNPARIGREAYLGRLEDAGVAASAGPWSAQAIKLERPLGVENLPGFDEGLVSVQDLAAQLAAPLLGAGPGERVLDACAAPGGKTAHLLELAPGIDLSALDVDPARCERIRENLARLEFKARVLAADLGAGEWWDGQPFARILLDAPCSATGVIRRHPDIKWLRRPSDPAALAATQARLLDAAWPMLAPGGRLLYATCSVLPIENQHLVSAFLKCRDDALEVPIEAAWGRPLEPGRQILPGEQDADGFYYALLEKTR